MAWKPEVQTVNDPKWYRNGLVFATEEEAYASAFNLSMRWSAVEDCRAVEVDEPVTHRLVDGNLEHVTK
jgi:hypothetical protein